jgi:hypothetical protein
MSQRISHLPDDFIVFRIIFPYMIHDIIVAWDNIAFTLFDGWKGLCNPGQG